MRQRIINFALRNLLHAVVLDDVIKQDKAGNIFIGGSQATEDQVRQLIAECKALEGFMVWKILNENIKKDALDRGWNNATNLDQLNTGKVMFYTLDLQKSIINMLRSKERK